MKKLMIALRIILVSILVIPSLSTATLTITDKQTITATDIAPITITTSTVIAEAGGPYNGTKCDPIFFTGSATEGCSPYTWNWDFGDGSTHSNQQNIIHQYFNDGTYTATLIVTDCEGAIDSDTASVTISTPILVADANGPYDGFNSIPINFYACASGGCPRSGCKPYNYSWHFGDGGSSTKQNPTHTYASSGEYTVTLSVTDDKNVTSIDITSATIFGSDLNVDADGPYYGEVNLPILFYSYVENDVPPYSYHWDFGDGFTSKEQNPTHTYSDPSPSAGYKVTLFVISSDGKKGWDQTRAYISDDMEGLTANAWGPYEGNIMEDIEFDSTVTGGIPPYEYLWDYGDGNTSTGDPHPTHNYGNAGNYTVILTVTDSEDDTASDTTWTYINAPPNTTVIDGPNSGKPGTLYTYTFTSTDLDGDDIAEYIINWGDGPNETITGPFISGTPQTKSHAWDSQGTYKIKAKAKDINGAESDWVSLEVSMPKSKAINLNLFLQRLFQRFPFFEKILNQ